MKLSINWAFLKAYFIVNIYLFSNTIQAQNRANTIKLNLANVFLGFPTLQYEHSLNNKLSYQLGFGFYSKANRGWNQNGAVFTINGQPVKILDEKKIAIISADIRYYFFNKSKVRLKGLYIAPHVLMNTPKFEKIAFGGNFGYQYIEKNRLTINLGSGISYEFERTNLNNFITSYPRIIISIGYSF